MQNLQSATPWPLSTCLCYMLTVFSITSLFKRGVWLTKCDWIMTWGDDTFEILLTAVGESSSKWSHPEKICILLEILKLWHYFHLVLEWTGEKYTDFIRRQELKKNFGIKKFELEILTGDPCKQKSGKMWDILISSYWEKKYFLWKLFINVPVDSIHHEIKTGQEEKTDRHKLS